MLREGGGTTRLEAEGLHEINMVRRQWGREPLDALPRECTAGRWTTCLLGTAFADLSGAPGFCIESVVSSNPALLQLETAFEREQLPHLELGDAAPGDVR